MSDLVIVYETLGGFKKYQRQAFLLCFIIVFFSSFPYVNDPFTFYLNPHRCFVPGCDLPNTTYDEAFVNNTVPYNDDLGTFDECSMYPSHQTNSSENNECQADAFNQNETVKCTQWVYDKEIFKSSLVTTFDLVCERAFLVPFAGSFYMAGMMLGSVVTGSLSDKYGRKFGILVSLVLFGVFGVGSSMVPNYPLFLVCRFFTGAGGIGLVTIPFVAVVELIDSSWRTFCGILVQVAFALGETSTGVLAYFIRDWRWLEAACTLPSIVIFFCYWYIPESIRWLISQNKINDAVKLVDQAAKVNKVESPSYLLKRDFKHIDGGTPKGNFLFALFKTPNMRKRTLILFYCWSICTATYYGLSRNTGNLSKNIFITYILTMLVEIPAYFVAYYLLDKIGRKGSQMSAFLLAGISCLVSGLLPPDYEWTVVSFSLVGKFGIAGAFAVVFVFSAELYPTEYRSFGVGACSTCGRVSGILAPFLATLSTIYQPLPLLIFGFSAILAGLLTLLLPETYKAELPQTIQESEDFGKNHEIWNFTCCNCSSHEE